MNMDHFKMAILLLVTLPAVALARAPSSVDHSLFTSILKDRVQGGLVDYTALLKDPRLDRYITSLSQTDPDMLSMNDRLAFWINAYNAVTLRLIRDNYPVKSINDLHPGGGLAIATLLKKTVWDTYSLSINGEKYTLNKIEHEILRPVFRDFRIHAAIVCASISCPDLREEAYQGNRINEQLDDQMKRFMADTSKNRYDPEKRIFYLSKIFSWFKKDFTRGQRPLVSVLRPYLPARSAWMAAAGSVKIKYLPYDWSLNDRK